VTDEGAGLEGRAKVEGDTVDYVFIAGHDVHVEDPIVDLFVCTISIEFGGGCGESLVYDEKGSKYITYVCRFMD